MPKKSAHRRALDKIVSNPSDFGIEDVRGYAIEMTLIHNRKVIAKPDIVFYCLNDHVWIIEFKGDGKTNGEAAEKAQNQVSRAASWLGRNTPYDPDKIHAKIISGDDPKYKKKLRKNAGKR